MACVNEIPENLLVGLDHHLSPRAFGVQPTVVGTSSRHNSPFQVIQHVQHVASFQLRRVRYRTKSVMRRQYHHMDTVQVGSIQRIDHGPSEV